MTKMVPLRVHILADDGVPVAEIKRKLKAMVRAGMVEAQERPERAGQTDIEGPDAGSIFWLTADVLEGVATKASPRRKAPAAGDAP